MLLDFKKRRKRTKSQYICSITPSANVLDRSPEPYQGKSLNHNPGEANSLVLHNREAKWITHSKQLDHQEAYLLILHSTRQAKNTEEKRSWRNHLITTLWHPLDRTTLSKGRWTIPSRLHLRPLDRKAESLKPSLINDIPGRAISAHQMLMTYSIVGS